MRKIFVVLFAAVVAVSGIGCQSNKTRVAEGSVIVAASEPRGIASDVAPDGFPHPPTAHMMISLNWKLNTPVV